MSEPGPVGYLFHLSSKKPVHPYQGSPNPSNDTGLVLYNDKNDPGRLQMRFVPVNGRGHFGYIEHVSSGKVVHPKGGRLDPNNDTDLVYHSDRHFGALFGFNEEDNTIIHIGGKIWHPKGGLPNPFNDNPCVLHSDKHLAAKFYFGDINGTPMSPYPSPNLSGDWKMIKHIEPNTSDLFIRYKVGKSQTKTITNQVAWSMTADATVDIFNASRTFGGFVQKAGNNTWLDEKEVSTTIDVEADKTIVVWQYVFAIRQYNEEISFQSDIIESTNSLHLTP